MNISMQNLLTQNEVMAQTKISRTTLWRWTKKGKIPFYRIGGQYRYILQEVLEATRGKQ